ncbi:MAG: hypothetical protein LUE96_10995 [Lachnospiraceae bacterium]|nr:hypothetical protein [Lachnospiraceae bacterium]
MLKVYDKAQWHIDAGADEATVVEKMKILFEFLNVKGLLLDEGKEILDLGIDDSVSIHERMLTEEGNSFMETKYDDIINTNKEEFNEALEKAFEIFAK